MKKLRAVGFSGGQTFNSPREAMQACYPQGKGIFAPYDLDFPDCPVGGDLKVAKQFADIGGGPSRQLPWVMEQTGAHYHNIEPNDSSRQLTFAIPSNNPEWTSRTTLHKDFSTISSHIKFDVILFSHTLEYIEYAVPEDAMNASDITNYLKEHHSNDWTIWIFIGHNLNNFFVRWFTECNIVPVWHDKAWNKYPMPCEVMVWQNQ